MRTMIAFGLCLCLAAPTLVAAQTPTPIAEAGVARIVMRSQIGKQPFLGPHVHIASPSIDSECAGIDPKGADCLTEGAIGIAAMHPEFNEDARP